MNTIYTIPAYRKLIFWISAPSMVFLLALYIFFMYLSVHMSYTFEYEQKLLAWKEHEYQKHQQKYVETLEGYHAFDILASEGFEKITSPVFLSRTSSVAFDR